MTNGLQIMKASVTGATGLIGRWLLVELTSRGIAVQALIRRAAERETALRDWVQAHGGRGELVNAHDIDLAKPDLGLDARARSSLLTSEAVYHLAARFDFGLSRAVAERANVQAAVTLTHLLGESATLRRLVHISGYRTQGAPSLALDVHNERAMQRFYTEHGAYEASKMQAHTRVAEAAEHAGVPLTRVSPAMVIGDSRTGETTQFTGLADMVNQLYSGRLPALAGDTNTWMPVIAVDTVAKLLTALPSDPESEGDHVLFFDDRTPALPELLGIAASRMHARAPSIILPTPLLRALPSALTGIDREALSFVSSDRYDPTDLARLCERVGVTFPPVRPTIERWVDHLIDTRFGQRPGRGGHNEAVGGVRTFLRGDRATAQVVYLHGLMLNEHSWTPVDDAVPTSSLSADLPGLGRSAPAAQAPDQWLSALLSPANAPQVLVAQSLGTAFAIAYATEHPERVKHLVLVSPFFAQARPSWALRQPWLFAAALRLLSDAKLASVLESPVNHSTRDAADLLALPSVRRHTARWLAWASDLGVRARLRRQLDDLAVPVTVIVGSNDPLHHEISHEVRVVEGAGHHPQLTHAEVVAGVVRSAVGERPEASLARARGAEARR